MPMKCGTRRSPPVVDQPTNGRPGPSSAAPTACAPAIPAKSSSCSGVGEVIRNATAMPARPSTSPPRMASARAASGSGERQSRAATTRVTSQTTAIEMPMAAHSEVASGEDTLKWLVVPAATAPTMTTISMTSPTVTTQAASRPIRCRRSGSRSSSQARVTA